MDDAMRARLKTLSKQRKQQGELQLLVGKNNPEKPRGKLALMALGSRGDFQPYLALVLRLQQAEQYGVEYFPIDYDIEDMLANSRLMRQVPASPDLYLPCTSPFIINGHGNHAFRQAMSGGNVEQFVNAANEAFAEVYMDAFAPLLTDLREFAPKLVLTGVVGRFFSLGLAEMFGIPSFWVDLQPLSPSREYPALVLDQLGLPSCGCLNQLSHTLFLNEACGGKTAWGQPDNPERRFRVREFGFSEGESITVRSLKRSMFMRPAFPVCVCVSAHIFSRPSDWAENEAVAGALTLPVETTLECNAPSESLVSFLAAGEPPVYIGWGSMVVWSPEHMTALACRALMQSGERGVVLSGWAHLSPSLLSPSEPDYKQLLAYATARIYFGNDMPHEWLFPRCKLTVHHGGSGTTHCALRSGRPTVITPAFLDQFTYRRLVADSGAGVAAPPLSKLTVHDLVRAIKRASSPEMVICAAQIAKLVRSENGADETLRQIESFLEEKVETGVWRDEFKAKWVDIKAER